MNAAQSRTKPDKSGFADSMHEATKPARWDAASRENMLLPDFCRSLNVQSVFLTDDINDLCSQLKYRCPNLVQSWISFSRSNRVTQCDPFVRQVAQLETSLARVHLVTCSATQCLSITPQLLLPRTRDRQTLLFGISIFVDRNSLFGSKLKFPVQLRVYLSSPVCVVCVGQKTRKEEPSSSTASSSAIEAICKRTTP